MSQRSKNLAVRLGAALILAVATAVLAADEAPKAAVDEARQASQELLISVRGELVKAIESSGPLRAIVVCKYSVPEIASSLSRKYGARITRVSLTPRNPSLGWGDAYEQRVLMDFDKRAARGEKVDGMEHHAVVDEPSGRFLRYMRALPMQPACMHCHGPKEQIAEAIRGQLEHDYPHDRALGLKLGQVRGAVTFKKPL